ncbi:MAG: hypothetical protein GXO00_01845, partial [Candidatus Diapherotrites archaeon]|nr:hypothetical protein [Candidatus Diapherotrites archaeon]
MGEEVFAVLGIMLLILFLGGILLLPQFIQHEGLSSAKAFYEEYVDAFVVFLSVILGLAVFAMAVGVYLATKSEQDAYILGAITLLVVRTILSTLDLIIGENVWLVRSLSHLLDLFI